MSGSVAQEVAAIWAAAAQSNDWPKHEPKLVALLRRDRKFDGTYLALAKVCEVLGRKRQVEKLIIKALAIPNGKFRAQLLLFYGLYLLSQERTDEAETILEQAVDLKSQLSQAELSRASAELGRARQTLIRRKEGGVIKATLRVVISQSASSMDRENATIALREAKVTERSWRPDLISVLVSPSTFGDQDGSAFAGKRRRPFLHFFRLIFLASIVVAVIAASIAILSKDPRRNELLFAAPPALFVALSVLSGAVVLFVLLALCHFDEIRDQGHHPPYKERGIHQRRKANRAAACAGLPHQANGFTKVNISCLSEIPVRSAHLE